MRSSIKLLGVAMLAFVISVVAQPGKQQPNDLGDDPFADPSTKYDQPIQHISRNKISWRDGHIFGGLQTEKPGLKVRITQKLTDMIKKHLLSYGVAYLNWDVQLPEVGEYKINLFPIITTFFWSNLRADPIVVDLDAFAFNYTHMKKTQDPVVYFQIPVVEKWRVYFDYEFWFIFHFKGQMSIEFRELELTCSVNFRATERGQLYPKIEALKINLTKSTLYHDKKFAEWWYRQFFDVFKHLF